MKLKAENNSICSEINYRVIFEQHSEVIRNFVYYRCGDIQQAEDITQDAFIKLWKNCKNVIFEKAKSFLMKVAQNTLFNEKKRDSVILKYNQSVDNSCLIAPSPENIIEGKEFMKELQRAISDLPNKQREVFLLNRKDKKTYKEIAEIVGITQKGVERRMHLALKELKDKICKAI